MINFAIFISVANLACYFSAIIDITSNFVDINGVYILSPWLEVGSVIAKSDSFVEVNTKSSGFYQPHVFMSIPHHGLENLYSGYQSCTRLNKISTSYGLVTFQVRIVQPNDSWCNFTWWSPQIEKPQRLYYMVAEEGHFDLDGAEFDIKSDSVKSHCDTQPHRHIFLKTFRETAIPSILAQAQSYHDPRFISFRTMPSRTTNAAVTFFIQLHNEDKKWRPRLTDCMTGHYEDHYDNNKWRQAYTINYEKISLIGYLDTTVGTCRDGISFEIQRVNSLSSNALYHSFYWSYTHPPAIFGMINSESSTDSVTIRIYNTSTVGTGIILQEDQCEDESLISTHTESTSLFILGISNQRNSPHAAALYPNMKKIHGNCFLNVLPDTEEKESNDDDIPSKIIKNEIINGYIEHKDVSYKAIEVLQSSPTSPPTSSTNRVCITYVLPYSY